MAQLDRKESWLVLRENEMAGTSNFPARKQSEIVQIVENVSAVKEIDSRFRCIPVKDIRQEMDFSACAVKGKA